MKKKIFNMIIAMMLLFSVLPTLSFAETSTPSNLDGVNIKISLVHSRSVEGNKFYNGERVTLGISLTGGTIALGKTYQVKLPNSSDGATDSEFAYLINTSTAQTDVMAGDAKVGTAVFNATTGELKITFDQEVSAADMATVSLATNMAINENDVTGSQRLEFKVDDSTIPLDIATTKNGFQADVTLSKVGGVGDPAPNGILNGSTVSLAIDWEALAGLGQGDYFEVSLPKTTDEGTEASLGILFNNATETMILEKDNIQYGTATLVSGTSGTPKIVFNFTNDSNEANISGKVKLNGRYYVTIQEERPEEITYTVYINGEKVEFPIVIGTPGPSGNFDAYQRDVFKGDRQGTLIDGKGYSVDVAPGEEFYKFNWAVWANMGDLPSVREEDTEGKGMTDVVLIDKVDGPGHYIDMNSIVIHYIADFNGAPIYGQIRDLPILNGGFAGTGQGITLADYIGGVGEGKVRTTPYTGNGDNNPTHITSYEIELGDIEKGRAIMLNYNTYIEEGEGVYGEIGYLSSFRDYFYQSVLGGGKSTAYSNTVTEKNTEKTMTGGMTSSDSSSTMTGGNLKLKIKKVDEQGNPQANVEFTLLYGGSSAELITDAQGIVEFTGLGAGLYQLKETGPLSGYQAIEPIGFKIPNSVDSKYEEGYIDLKDPLFEANGALSAVDSGNMSVVDGKMTGYNQITNQPIGETEPSETELSESTPPTETTTISDDSPTVGGTVETPGTTDNTVPTVTDDEPGTGDTSNMAIWFALIGISLVAIVLSRKHTFAKKRK